MANGTAHNHKQAFGRKFHNCPRCQELLAGAEPRAWGKGGDAKSAHRGPTVVNLNEPHRFISRATGAKW